MVKLTQIAVDSLKFEGKEKILFCEAVPGFGVRLTPSGSKLFVAQGRLNKKSTRISIGNSTEISVADAKRKARRVLAEIAEGVDPRHKGEKRRQEEMQFRSFSEVWLDQKVAVRATATTVKDYRGVLERHILPMMGSIPLSAIDFPHLIALQQKLKDRPRTANMAVGLVRSIINFAERKQLRPQGTNPGFKFEMLPEQARERFLSDDEVIAVDIALDQLAGNGLTPWTTAAIRLLMLTGARSSEIRSLLWDQIDEERGLAILPTSKNRKIRTIYLSAEALRVLSGLPRRGRFVIAGNSIDQMCGPLTKQWEKVRKKANIEDVNLHDLRHTFASAALAHGLHLPAVGKILGHESVQATARYAHLASDPITQAAHEVGAKIAATMKGEAFATGDVVRMKRAKK